METLSYRRGNSTSNLKQKILLKFAGGSTFDPSKSVEEFARELKLLIGGPDDPGETAINRLRYCLAHAEASSHSPVFPAGALHYWPLNEAGGVRSDIIAGLDMAATGTVLQVGGPLDFAVQINEGLDPSYLKTATEISLRNAGEWSVNFWQNFPGNPDNFITLGQFNNYSEMDWWVEANTLNSLSRVVLGDSSVHQFSYPPVVYEKWNMATLNFIGGKIELYMNATLLANFPDATSPNVTPTSFFLGDLDGEIGGAQQISDVGMWQRSLTGPEITDLFNGGIPLRP